jgi:ABC-type multidrug transport system ATPase subunit/ABC-type multidrug transport system permease subunit
MSVLNLYFFFLLILFVCACVIIYINIGSGKTTLLNVLSGRSSYQDGSIRINGEVLTGQSRKRLMSKIAYVKQSDIFFEHLTVRDQLLYTAFLRLSSSHPTTKHTSNDTNSEKESAIIVNSRERKLEEVEKVITLLRLQKVADSPIMMCSGGEKKRVNIGTELLTDPQVLLLDEPTSGLDSTNAVALMELLKKLARTEGKTVITSIHQPNSAVFRSFDKLLMLADGNVVYFGNPVGSLTYLSSLGFMTPVGYNAADHWMDLLVHDDCLPDDNYALTNQTDDSNIIESTDVNEDIGVTSRSHASTASKSRQLRKSSLVDRNKPRGILTDAWCNQTSSQETPSNNNTLFVSGENESFQQNLLIDVKKYNTDWLTQYLVLTHRSMKNSRSAIFTVLNFTKSAALGIVAGMLFFQTKMTESSVRNISSFFFFTMTYWVFDAMFNSLMAFPSERTVILKERASASYRLSAYFMAKTTSEAPTRVILPLVYCIIAYWMSGVNSKFSVFLGTTGCTLMSVLAGESIGLFIGASIYDLQKALTVMTVFALALMLLGGFYSDNVPDFISWARFLSPFKYAFDAAQLLVFDANVPCDGSGALRDACNNSSDGYATPEEVLKFLRVEGSIGFQIGMLWVICIVPRYLAYLALRSKKSGDRE